MCVPAESSWLTGTLKWNVAAIYVIRSYVRNKLHYVPPLYN